MMGNGCCLCQFIITMIIIVAAKAAATVVQSLSGLF